MLQENSAGGKVSKIRERLSLVLRLLGALAAAAVGVLLYGWSRYRRGKEQGAQGQRSKDREADVQEAGEKGDSGRLDDYWSGKR